MSADNVFGVVVLGAPPPTGGIRVKVICDRTRWRVERGFKGVSLP